MKDLIGLAELYLKYKIACQIAGICMIGASMGLSMWFIFDFMPHWLNGVMHLG